MHVKSLVVGNINNYSESAFWVASFMLFGVLIFTAVTVLHLFSGFKIFSHRFWGLTCLFCTALGFDVLILCYFSFLHVCSALLWGFVCLFCTVLHAHGILPYTWTIVICVLWLHTDKLSSFHSF